MKRIKSLLNILAAALIMILSVDCTYAAFRDMKWSARSAGMGGAFTAVSDDSSGILYNPAGIIQADTGEVNLMYAKLFTGLDKVNLGLSYGAFMYPVEKIGTIGINWANFASVNQYREDTFTIAYARGLNDLVEDFLGKELVPAISIGCNLKYLSHTYKLDKRTVGDPVFENGDSQEGISIDLGIWSRPLPDICSGLTAGVMLKNINQPDLGLKTEDIVPMETRVSAAYKIDNFGGLSDILTCVDFEHRKQEWGKDEDKINIHAGVEAWAFNRILAFRMGGNYTEVSAGFSVLAPEDFMLNLKLDYAFLWPLYITETMGTHRVSVSYRF
ncbi:hypothetical protein ACFLUV_01555 [Elusimicrobiota bacterium]